MKYELYKFDLENRTGFAVTFAKDGSIYTVVLKDGSTVVGRDSAADKSFAVQKIWERRFGGALRKPRLTTAQRNTISPRLGRRITNIDRNCLEWWDGDVWLAANRIKCMNKDPTTMQEGHAIRPHANTDTGVILTASLGAIKIVGVVVDVYGDPTPGAQNEFVTVAIYGIAKVLCNGTIARSDLVKQSTVAGEAVASGGTKTGVFAVARQERSGEGSSLVECYLQTTEKA